jgi:hypothetical protein
MARQTLTKQTPKGPYPTLPVAVNSLDVAWTAANATDKEQFVPGNDTLVLVKNSHATLAKTITFTSKADSQNRTGDVTAYSLGAGEIAMFRFKKAGWMQSDGKIYMEAESSDISYAVIQL